MKVIAYVRQWLCELIHIVRREEHRMVMIADIVGDCYENTVFIGCTCGKCFWAKSPEDAKVGLAHINTLLAYKRRMEKDVDNGRW